MSIRTRWFPAIGCLCALACNGDRNEICSTASDGLSVRYFGQAYGYGTIHVSKTESGETFDVTAQMMGPDSNAEIQLSGEGTCTAGVLRARLGAGVDEESGIRVLGGSLVVLFDHPPLPEVTGLWEVHAIMPGSTQSDAQEYRFRGMLERVINPKIGEGPPPEFAAEVDEVDGEPAPR